MKQFVYFWCKVSLKDVPVVMTNRTILYVTFSCTNDSVTRECKLIFKSTTNKNWGYLVTIL